MASEGRDFWGDEVQWEGLVEKSRGEDPLERWAVVFALSDAEDARAEKLLRQLQADEDLQVAQAAAAAVRRIEAHRGRPPQLRRRRSAVADYRDRLEAGLAPRRNELLPLLDDERVLVRAAAAQSLGELGDVRSGGKLIELALDDLSPLVRRACATALGFLGDEASCEVLVELLADRSTEVRCAAAQALGEACEATAAEALAVVLLNDEDWTVRLAACRALGDCAATVVSARGDGRRRLLLNEEAREALIEAAEDDIEEEVRETAAAVLLELDDLEETTGGGSATFLV